MRERWISKSDVEETLSHPLDVTETRHGRKAALGRLDAGKFIVVIFEGLDEDLIVVTSLKVDRDRLERYGFIGIR